MSIDHTIVLLVSWLLLICIQVLIHFILIEVRNEKPFYLVWNIIRGMFAILHGIAFDVQNMADYAPVLLFQLMSHFVIFAPMLNTLRKKSFWYLGGDSGWIDKMLNKLHGAVYKCIYGIASILLAYSIVWISRVFGL